MKGLADCSVVIVGLGQMGGSLAGALRGRCRAVVGVVRQAETAERALARGLVDRATAEREAALHAADVVVLASPVRAILRLIEEIGPLLPRGCLLMDLGSTKAQIVAKMAGLPRHVQPLGGHPMCGREVAGLAAADPALFRGRPFILTPLPRTSAAALNLGRALVAATGAYPVLLQPERHDHLVATASHLPYLLACALVGTAEEAAHSDPLLWGLVAGGFRDTSRLAASDVTMMLDILLTNREPLLPALRAFQSQLQRLAGLIETADEGGLHTTLPAICDRRKGLDP